MQLIELLIEFEVEMKVEGDGLVQRKRGRGRPPKTRNGENDDAKTKLIQSATRLFARYGYDGATVKELCDAAEVNVSLISYYFDGKQGLYRAVLEKYGTSKLSSAERILKDPSSAEEFKVKMRLFVEDMLAGYAEDPELTTIVYRETESPNDFIEDIFREKFLRLYDRIVGFFESARDIGIIRQDFDGNICAGLLHGGLSHFGRMLVVAQKYSRPTIREPEFLRQLTDHVMVIYLEGMLASNS